jgi:hypothetical protein
MKRTVIAAAVLASAASSAFAFPPNPYLFNVTGVVETVGIFGWVELFGCVSVSSTAGAVIDNTQSVTLSHVSLDPLYQSYTKGKVTTSVNNTYSSVTDTGGAFFTGGESQSLSESESIHSHSSTTTNSNAWVVEGEYYNANAKQTSSLNASANAHQSANSGGSAFIAGGAGYAAGTYNAANVTAYAIPLPFGFTAGTSTSTASAGYIVGAAGAIWGENTYANQSASLHEHESQTASLTESEFGAAFEASHSSTSTSASSSESLHEHESASLTAYALWAFSNTLSSINVSTTGSVTQYINTEVASTLTATTGAGAATGVTGNLGVNIAEGVDNAQSNDVALASVDVGNVFGNAQIFSNQTSSGTARINDFHLNASIGDGSLAAVSGNVGVNVASGVGNVQNNSLAGSVTTVDPTMAKTVAMVATDDNTQMASAQISGRFDGTAELGAGTLVGATGNIGVNIAGGAGNLQHNGLAIAALNNGH